MYKPLPVGSVGTIGRVYAESVIVNWHDNCGKTVICNSCVEPLCNIDINIGDSFMRINSNTENGQYKMGVIYKVESTDLNAINFFNDRNNVHLITKKSSRIVETVTIPEKTEKRLIEGSLIGMTCHGKKITIDESVGSDKVSICVGKEEYITMKEENLTDFINNLTEIRDFLKEQG